MPPLDIDENGSVTLVPGELYCRWRDLRGTLCPKKKRFNSHTALSSHLKEVHKLQVAGRRRGNLNFSEDQNVQQWYTDMDAGRMPSWPLGQSGEAALDENSAQVDREPSHSVDAGDVLPAGAEDSAQADRQPSNSVNAGDVPQTHSDDVLPAGGDDSVQPDREPRPSADSGDAPPTPVKQDPDCKSESGPEEESSDLEPPLRMDLPWDASGNPDIREMRRLCDKDDAFRCQYCQEKGRGRISNVKEEVDEDDFMPSAY
ncbi:uncharacterized protein FTOL_08243 [Fusarium torulosum]|uniref:Uncharacterized protein n=1 Tax=Fusarium torulosum TaxID=33205 RepID=A0AAE8SKI4_9HYPO|nr:uncharacterized protein FTOL_08243 [Fusarium torulosum]